MGVPFDLCVVLAALQAGRKGLGVFPTEQKFSIGPVTLNLVQGPSFSFALSLTSWRFFAS
jgi:hypothetical protein